MGLTQTKRPGWTVCDRHGYRHTTGRTTLCHHPDCLSRIMLALSARSRMAKGVVQFCSEDPQVWDDFVAFVASELARKPPNQHFLDAQKVFWIGSNFMKKMLRERARAAVTEQYEEFELTGDQSKSTRRAVHSSGLYKLYAREVIALGNQIDPVCTAHCIGLVSTVEAVKLSGEPIGK